MIKTIAIAACLLAPIATEAATCGDKSAALANLHDKYGEVPSWVAVMPTGDGDQTSPVMMTMNRDTGTWTLLQVVAKGGDAAQLGVCLLAAGRGAEMIEASAPDAPSEDN